MSGRDLKREAAAAAIVEVRNGMRLGLGTGSTAAAFVQLLGAEIRGGRLRNILCTSTSEQTDRLAAAEGIATVALAEALPLDLAVDGADEIDDALRLIKGRGGALLREKIVEQAARRFIVIADESKLVARLGEGPLPVEVTPFAEGVLTHRWLDRGYLPVLRMADGQPRVTDEGHRIIDITVPAGRDIADLVAEIRASAGVVETGFFPTEAHEAIIASGDGIRRLVR